MSTLVTQSAMPGFEEYIEEIKPIFESYRLTNMGPIYKKFQHQLKDYLTVPQLSLFTNGHVALEFVLQAMKLKGEVITTPYTFASTSHAIVRNGLKPVFCDIKPDDYTINPEIIESLITEKTCAIVPVHVYGSICDVEAIELIAKKHNLKVVYDAAHAFGASYKGIGAGNFGDASIFSFHATKVFHTIEGGAVSFVDESLCKPLHCLKNFGITGVDRVEDVGGNAKLDEFRAAMGICNLRHLEENIAKRKRVYERYIENLKDVKGIRFIQYKVGMKPNYSYFPIYVDPELFGRTRDELLEKLQAHDIFARRYFYPATNNFECYKEQFPHGDTPVSDKVSYNILTLPMYADLSLEEVDRVCRLIHYE